MAAAAQIRSILRDKAIVQLSNGIEAVLPREFVSARLAPEQIEDLGAVLQPGQVVTGRVVVTLPKCTREMEDAIVAGGRDPERAFDGQAYVDSFNELAEATAFRWYPDWGIGPFSWSMEPGSKLESRFRFHKGTAGATSFWARVCPCPRPESLASCRASCALPFPFLFPSAEHLTRPQFELGMPAIELEGPRGVGLAVCEHAHDYSLGQRNRQPYVVYLVTITVSRACRVFS